MTGRTRYSFVAALACSAMVLLASCTTEQKAPPKAAPASLERSVTTESGVAGGTVENVFIAQAVVTAIDQSTRRVTLAGPEGNKFTFTAGPEVKNLAQVRVGDKVTATFARRLVVTVRSDDAAPSLTVDATRATALRGEKPGMLVAEETEVVARVTGIDPVARTADLSFADGTVKNVPIRADVDLSRYKVGDNVVIRVTNALTVLVRSS